MKTNLHGPVLTLFLLWTSGQQLLAANPAEKCVIEGRVVNALTGEPLRKARVEVRNLDGRQAPGAITDASGTFVITGVDPGKYRLRADRSGFIRGEYGARFPERPGAILSLEPGQRLKDAEVRLVPQSAISGRVVDQDFEPTPSADVFCLQPSFVKGEQYLMPVWTGVTDDLGQFRIYGLVPGRYFIGAKYRPARPIIANGKPKTSPEESYVPTYYPGTTELATAAPIDVGPGADIQGIELPLARELTVRVSGRVVNGASPTTMVMLRPRNSPEAGFLHTKTASVKDQKGAFEIQGVPPGSYFISAELTDRGVRYSARELLEVGSADVEGLNLTLAPGSDISGVVRFGVGSADIASLRVNLRSKHSPLNAATDTVKQDGTFLLRSVPADAYTVQLTGIPDGFYIKSIKYGDQDVLGKVLDLSHGAAAGQLSVVLSNDGGRVEGAVLDDQQNPRWGTVVLVPESSRRGQIYRYKTTTTDQYGRFALSGIPPGEYKLFAWEDIENDAYYDPGFLERYEDLGETISISENTQVTSTLKVIPAKPAP